MADTVNEDISMITIDNSICKKLVEYSPKVFEKIRKYNNIDSDSFYQ